MGRFFDVALAALICFTIAISIYAAITPVANDPGQAYPSPQCRSTPVWWCLPAPLEETLPAAIYCAPLRGEHPSTARVYGSEGGALAREVPAKSF